MNESSSSFSN